METGKLAKQLIDMQKAAFNNTFGAMVALQDQAEKMVNLTIEQSTWLPKDGKRVVSEWTEAYKKGRDDYKKFVNENFSRVEGFFADLAKASTSPATSAAKSK